MGLEKCGGARADSHEGNITNFGLGPMCKV